MGWQNIDHVVVLMQENLSFDRVFGWMRREAGEGEGVPAGLRFPIYDPLFPPGTVLSPSQGASLIPPGAAHLPWNMLQGLFGAPNGGGALSVMLERAHKTDGITDDDRRELVREVLRYMGPDDLPVYRTLVKHYAVADRWFAPIASSTWPNRYFMHLGTSPTGGVPLPQLGGSPATIFDSLNEAGLTWRIYVDGPATLVTSRSVVRVARDTRKRALAAGVSEADASPIRSFDRFVCDVACSSAAGLPPALRPPGGELPAGVVPLPTYTFIEPRHWPSDGRPANNDHHHTHMHEGQRLVATIYNALRADPERWARTLFVITYDEHGGYWDHVDPPPAVDPRTGRLGDAPSEGAMDWRGGRVPALLISPWINAGAYTAVVDHTAVLAFLERRFDLPALSQRDAHSDDLTAAFGDTLRLGPDRIEPPAPPPPVPRTGDLDRDFTEMALGLYRELGAFFGVDADAELITLSPDDIAARGEERARQMLRLLSAGDPRV